MADRVLAEDGVCPAELESLPVLGQGRVKPLRVHAKEMLRFISGSSRLKGLQAVQLYCELSLSQLFSGETSPPKPNLPVSHKKTQEYLGLKDGQKEIPFEEARLKLQDMRAYAAVLEARDGKDPFFKDLRQVIARVEAVESILRGHDWKFPVVLNPDQINPHEPAAVDPVNYEIRWLSVSDLPVIFPDEFEQPAELVTAIATAGQKYAHMISNAHHVELLYDKISPFDWAMAAVLITLALSVIFKNRRVFWVWIGVGAVLLLEITGVVFRVMISGRGPVTNMYETVMWVGLGGLVFAAALALFRKEWLYLKLGLALNLCTLFMMRFANGMLDPAIQPLVPVLRDNFWLSTHVTCVTISYAAFALGWMIANFYLVKSAVRGMQPAETRRFGMLCYDCIKIGVVLLAAGVILGGVWADYSWGRFWGWDPKETWALVALLCYMVILHGRYAGWITPRRFMPVTAFAFLSVIMAWFGVNYILATGLHSYGFSEGGAFFIAGVTGLQLLILVFYFVGGKSRGGFKTRP